RSVRKSGVPSMKSSGVAAPGVLASIFACRVLNSARVRSLVQHFALVLPGVQGALHLSLRGVLTMSVVVARSHSECRHTSWRSEVNVTSHSTMPAPIRAAASYDSLECSGNCRVAPRWPIEKSVLWKGRSLPLLRGVFRHHPRD